MKQEHQRPTEPTLILTIYRCFWLLAFAVFVIAACSWADCDMRGKSPEKTEVRP